MAQPAKCSRCDADLPPDSPGGHCVKCLLLLGVQPNETEDSQTGGTIRINPSSAAPLTEKAGDRIGNYKLLEQIGEGGCGVVYMAEQTQPIRRRVAFKLIKLGMDTRQVIARFEAERQALALMEHPSIAKVFDAGATDTGRPFFVMELVRGLKITDYCDQQKLSTHQRLELFMQVCQAVQHAHQKGIIHRDLKPSNILVTEQDGQPVPKVIDFGIAKATTDQRLTDKTLFTAFEQFIGTPAYMSPEQAGMGGLDIDTRSDIYSLGVLLYELLTGKPPFDPAQFRRSALEETLRLIRDAEPPRPSSKLTTLSEVELTTVAARRQTDAQKLPGLLRGDLDWIVMKALEKNRSRRYETAIALAQDLARHLRSEPIEAAPPSLVRRLKLYLRREWKAATINVLLGLATLIIVAIQWLGVESSFGRVRIPPGNEFNGLFPYIDRWTMTLHIVATLGAICALLFATRKSARRAITFICGAALLISTGSLLAYRMAANPLDARLTVPGFTGYLTYASDGTLYSTLSSGEVRSWQRPVSGQTKDIRLTPIQPHKAIVSPDGSQLAVVCNRQAIFLLDRVSGKTNSVIELPGDTDAVFSPDGKRLAVVVPSTFDATKKTWVTPVDGNLRIYSTADGRLLTSEKTPDLLGYGQPLDWKQNVIAYTEAYLANNRGVLLWDINEHRMVQFLARAGGQGGLSVSLSADATKVAVGYAPYDVGIWDAKSGKLLRMLISRNNWVVCLAFSPDGRTIASGEGDSAVRLWDVESGQQLRCLRMGDPTRSDYTRSVAFDPTGRFLACGSEHEAIVLWKLDSRRGNR